MAIKKSQIYSSLWSACDDLRGGIEPASYKDYVLVLLFVKYISDKYVDQSYAPIKVPKGSTFQDLIKLKGKIDIGVKINKKILSPIAEENNFNTFPDFNDSQKLGSGKEMVDRLTNLIAVFENKNLDFTKNRADGDDILGDAYEYLMRNFASESGKKKGAFYTPSEVSRIISLVIGISDDDTSSSTTVYDPTCGSGSLLLKVNDAAKSNISIYGQELDISTAVLSQMNMILHDNPTARIVQGNALSDPKFLHQGNLKKFDYIVANPPFSDKRWSTGINPETDKHNRFKIGIPPIKQGDYAYMLHVIESLKSNGKAAIIMPHGVLFRGNTEEDIRKKILEKKYIKGIIGLPSNLFYGTGIPACIIIIDKSQNSESKGIFMINASDGFKKDGPKNRLREMDVRKIVEIFKTKKNIKDFSRFIKYEEIEKNNFNLNLSRYVANDKSEDVQDISAHINGGIPDDDINNLEDYWLSFPKLKSDLFEDNRKGYKNIKIHSDKLYTQISNHNDFITFNNKASTYFKKFFKKILPKLEQLKKSFKPKEKIEEISEILLNHYYQYPIINHYRVYQELMEYWNESLSDDFYQISSIGWKVEIEKIIAINKKGHQIDKGWKCDLIPKSLLISKFFFNEKKKIDELIFKLEELEDIQKNIEEENSTEEGIFTDFDVINKKNINDRIAEIEDHKNFKEEINILKQWIENSKKIQKFKKELKEKYVALDKITLIKYSKLKQDEIKNILIYEKWMPILEKKILDMTKETTQYLIRRLRELIDRYEITLPELQKKTDSLEDKIKKNIKEMGYSWD